MHACFFSNHAYAFRMEKWDKQKHSFTFWRRRRVTIIPGMVSLLLATEKYDYQTGDHCKRGNNPDQHPDRDDDFRRGARSRSQRPGSRRSAVRRVKEGRSLRRRRGRGRDAVTRTWRRRR